MDNLKYNYMGKTWRPCPTAAEGNCFFNSVFGTRNNKDQPYLDKYAKFRRVYWSAFLTYYSKGDLEGALLELLRKCFIANDKYQQKTIENPDNYTEYTHDITVSDYWVLVEEIPLLATLENIRVILFIGDRDKPEVFDPNPKLLRKFPFRRIGPIREVVISVGDKHFSRLEPYDQSNEIEPVINEATFMQNKNLNRKMSSFTRKKHYKKRGDTGIHGGLYQINVLTMVLLNGITKVKHWYLSTEDEEVDKFDDLIFEFLPSEFTILLQAKHKKDKNMKVTYEDLVSANYRNDFSLPKYFVSYQNILKRNKFKVQNIVICTNLDLDENAKNYFNLESLDAENVLHFQGTDNICYSFKGCYLPLLKQNIEAYCAKNVQNKKVRVTDEAIEDFLAHLQFFPKFLCEENLHDVGKIISGELFKDLDTKIVFKDVHKKMLDWIEEEKGRYLTEVEAKGFLCDIRSSKYCDDLKLYDISFEQNILSLIIQNQHKKGEDSKCLQQQIESSLTDAKRILHLIPEKQYILNVIKVYQALKSGDETKALFVNPDETIDVQKQIIDTFEIEHYKILVIVCHKNVGENDAMEMCEKVIEILNNYTYKRVILISEKSNNLASLIKKSSISYVTLTDSITFTDLDPSTQEKFKQMKNINFQGSTMSLEELFRPCTNAALNLSVDSEILVKLARGDEIKIGLAIQHPNRHYVCRTFIQNGNHIPEENMCHPDEISKEKVAIISDSAGMGKTTVLTSLAPAVKKYNPHLWVIRVDLINYTNIMRTTMKTGVKDISILQILESQGGFKLKSEFEKKVFMNRERIVLMLDGVDEVCPSYADLILNLLKELSTQLNIAKIIVTTRPHLCGELEQVLKVQAITMEPFSEDNQTNFLTNYWSEKLQLRDNIKKKKCEHYAIALIRKMFMWINDNARNMFAGIPLQTKMLAEVFQEENRVRHGEFRDWEGCKEFLASEDEEPRLPKKINLIRLYEIFIDKKRDIFLNDKSNPGGSAAADEALKEKLEKCHEYHRSLASELIFYKYEDCNLFTCDYSSSFVENYVLRMGLVQLRGEKLHFIHRTFAEYFAAEWMLIELKSEIIDPQLYRFLMQQIFYAPECDVVRVFLDNFIKAEPPTVKNKIFKRFWTHDDLSHISHKCILQIARSGCSEILISFVEFIEMIRIGTFYIQFFKCPIHKIIDYDEPLKVASRRGFLDIVKILVGSAQIWTESGFSKVTKLSHLDVIKFLEERHDAEHKFVLRLVSIWKDELNIQEDEEKSSVDFKMALYNAANNGHLHLVKFLVNFVHANEVCWYNLCVCAASGNGYLDIVKFLVEKAGADVYLMKRGVDDYNKPFELAANNGDAHVIKFLAKFADVDEEHLPFISALCMASSNGHLDIVKFLVEEAGANININAGTAESALTLASERGHLGVVKYLVERGARDCSIALIAAAGYGCLDIVKFLVEFTDVDEVNSNGMTALCAAAWSGHIDIVKFLVEEVGADVYKKSEFEVSAVEMAYKGGHLSVVAYLMGRNAIE